MINNIIDYVNNKNLFNFKPLINLLEFYTIMFMTWSNVTSAVIIPINMAAPALTSGQLLLKNWMTEM